MDEFKGHLHPLAACAAVYSVLAGRAPDAWESPFPGELCCRPVRCVLSTAVLDLRWLSVMEPWQILAIARVQGLATRREPATPLYTPYMLTPPNYPILYVNEC